MRAPRRPAVSDYEIVEILLLFGAALFGAVALAIAAPAPRPPGPPPKGCRWRL